MKKILLTTALVVGLATVANAKPFENIIDFNDTQLTVEGITKTGKWIDDTLNTSEPGSSMYNFAFTYAHIVDFNPEAITVNEAYLDITFTGNLADDNIEAWFVYDLGDLGKTQEHIGFFGHGQGLSWQTQTFDLPQYITDVSGANWSIAFSIDENTPLANEQLFIAESRLRGNYNPVPEPATMMLFGAGLAGLGRRRK